MKILSMAGICALLTACNVGSPESGVVAIPPQPDDAVIQEPAGPDVSALTAMVPVLGALESLGLKDSAFQLSASSNAFAGKTATGDLVIADTSTSERQFLVVGFSGLNAGASYEVTISGASFQENSSFSLVQLTSGAGDTATSEVCRFKSDDSPTGDFYVICSGKVASDAEAIYVYVTPAVSDVDGGFEDQSLGGLVLKSFSMREAN